MQRLHSILLCLILSGLVCCSLTATAQDRSVTLPPGVTDEMVRKGNALFHGRGLCFNCHGGGAQGFIGPDLTDSEWLQSKGSFLSILQVILSGIPAESSSSGTAMPERGGAALSDVEVQSVAAFVWRTSHPNDPLPAGVLQEMVDEGEAIFNDKGQCTTCHGKQAQGGIGPDLTDSEWLQAKGSYLEIVNIINAGIPISRSSRGIPMPARGGANLTNEEVHALGAYVWVLSQED